MYFGDPLISREINDHFDVPNQASLAEPRVVMLYLTSKRWNILKYLVVLREKTIITG